MRHHHEHHRWRHRRHHHHRWKQEKLRNPLLGYFRRRLRRRLFAWFGVAIVLTGVFSGAVAWFWSSGSPGRGGDIATFATHRFEAVWDDPNARSLLAETIATDLPMGVHLEDTRGAVLDTHGPSCDRPYRLEIADRGVVKLCAPYTWHAGPIEWAPLLVGGLALWFASGVIAFRLTRPLAQLVRVTREIGEGNLDARMEGRIRSSELSTIADAVNLMAERIQSMLGAERELLASVSHEIRTPLGHIRVLLDTARDNDPSSPLLDELDREVDAIDTLVGQLLANSRLDFDRIEPRPLDAVALAVRALERADIDPTRLTADAERLSVSADATLVLQALANLLRNAEEHGSGVHELKVHMAGSSVVFSVEDRGPGFDDLDQAFSRGYQGADGKGALGLGLALVRRIAEAHGGSAHAENLPQGARVSLHLPTPPSTLPT